MEDLLKVDYGVLFLTIFNFLLVVFLLYKFAWKSIIGALEKRENQIAEDKRQAAQARQQAEQVKKELDDKLSEIARETAKKIEQAVSMGEAQKEQILKDTKQQAEQLITQAKQQIEAEKQKVLCEVQSQIASTAILAAAKVAKQQINAESAQAVVDQVLAEVKAHQ